MRSFKPWQYCPFGGGNRRCIGAAFAVFEMKIVLATLFSHFDLELIERRAPRPVRRNVTMGPDSKVPVRLGARRP
jgi:cytochrome P450